MKLAKCHPNRKLQAREMCKNCYDKWLKVNNPKYKENQIVNHNNWANKNKDKLKIYYKKRNEKRNKDPKYKLAKRNARLLKQYGLSLNDYDNLLNIQNGGCAICYRKPTNRPLHVDHDHITGKVRGLLCHQCNWYLGTIDADPNILSRIKCYLHL